MLLDGVSSNIFFQLDVYELYAKKSNERMLTITRKFPFSKLGTIYVNLIMDNSDCNKTENNLEIKLLSKKKVIQEKLQR